MEKLNKRIDLAKTNMHTTAQSPPKRAEKKFVKICKQMFAIKCPNKLEGAIISEYFKVLDIILICKLGTAFLIFLVFNSVIKLIDMKCDTMILFIPINGVKIINETNSATEPDK